jgi:hypothetical protein
MSHLQTPAGDLSETGLMKKDDDVADPVEIGIRQMPPSVPTGGQACGRRAA